MIRRAAVWFWHAWARLVRALWAVWPVARWWEKLLIVGPLVLLVGPFFLLWLLASPLVWVKPWRSRKRVKKVLAWYEAEQRSLLRALAEGDR